jgi:hypothetical protein
METDENPQHIPASLLAKHPELARIDKAIDSFLRGEAVTARCLICNELLTVTYIEAIASTWVTCPNNCTFYHSVAEK